MSAALEAENEEPDVEEAAAVKRFVLADLNRMITRSKRIGASFVGGTPDSGIARGVTDIICSPEIVEELRAIAYNPINTKAAPAGGDGVRTSDVIAEEAYSAAGAPTFYGINVIELNEMKNTLKKTLWKSSF